MPSSVIETATVRLKRQGPPSVLEFGFAPLRQPGENEVVVAQKAIALNFVDVLFRNGSFPLPDLPAIIGVEAAGMVEAVGKKVLDFKQGDRVAYYFSLGAYTERRVIPEFQLIKVPSDISFDQTAALLAKGLTARMLIKQVHRVAEGDVVLVHAAAGGVGSLVAKWAKAIGATVIGTVGSDRKKDVLRAAGVDLAISLESEDLQTAVEQFIGVKSTDVVFDGVGQTTFNRSLPLIKSGGKIVLYGTSSGTPTVDDHLLSSQGITLIKPSLGQYLNGKEAIESAAQDLFDALRNGLLGVINPTIYPLMHASRAHQDLESGKTIGSVIFHP